MVLFSLQISFFLPNITMGIMANLLNECFIRTFLHKVQSLHEVQLQTLFSSVSWWFWRSSFFFAEWPSYRIGFTVDLDVFVLVLSSIFTRSFAVVLVFICTFHAEECSFVVDRRLLLPLLPWCNHAMIARQWFHCVYTSWLLCKDEQCTFRCLEMVPAR